MNAHDLASLLLAGPNLPVWARNPSDLTENVDHPIYIDGIAGVSEHGSCEDNEGYEEGDETVTDTVLLLDLHEDDGWIE